MADSLPRWRDKRFLVLLALGFAAGVPLPLSAFTLRQWLAESNLSLAAIGFTALIGLSYSLKFLWSPLIDHSPPPFFRGLGRRRGWLLSIQIPLIGAIIALGQTNPALDVGLTVAVAVLVAFLSASQDIVIDAFRIESLDEADQGYGLACYIWGYRGALLAATAGALTMVEFAGWAFAFAGCAAMVGLGVIAVLFATEPTRMGGAAPQVNGMHVYGPAPAPLAMLRGRHRQRLLVHAQRSVEVQNIIREWLGGLQFPRGVRVGIDVDPYSFL